MSIINYGKINRKLMIPIFGGIIRLLYRYIIDLNPKYEALTNNPFLMSIYTAIGMTFAFIPFLILKKRIRKIDKNSENRLTLIKIEKSKSFIKYEYYDINKKTKNHKYKLIFFSTIFDFLETLLTYCFCKKFIYNFWIFRVLFISIFSYFILKIKLYKHQYFSMIIMIILGFGLNIIEYFKSDKKEKSNLIEILIKLIIQAMASLTYVINKFNMEKNFCTPYEICFWEGGIEVILYIIGLYIINRVGLTISDIKHPDNFNEYKRNFDKIDIILALIHIIISGIYNVFILLTCDYFTPYHVLFILIIHQSYYYFKIDENIIFNIIGFFILLLIFFMLLFFIELLEFNLYGFSMNTKKNIGIRAMKEHDDNFEVGDFSLDDSQIEKENIDDEGKNISLKEI